MSDQKVLFDFFVPNFDQRFGCISGKADETYETQEESLTDHSVMAAEDGSHQQNEIPIDCEAVIEQDSHEEVSLSPKESLLLQIIIEFIVVDVFIQIESAFVALADVWSELTEPFDSFGSRSQKTVVGHTNGLFRLDVRHCSHLKSPT